MGTGVLFTRRTVNIEARSTAKVLPTPLIFKQQRNTGAARMCPYDTCIGAIELQNLGLVF